MWRQQLAGIKVEKAKYNALLNEPAADGLIVKFTVAVKSKFGHVLPEGYIDFLKTVNGLEYNGFIFYGIDSSLGVVSSNEAINGYIENNEIWYKDEHQRPYMFFGESCVSCYCLDLFQGLFVERDSHSGALLRTYADFGSLLEKALKDSLLSWDWQ